MASLRRSAVPYKHWSRCKRRSRATAPPTCVRHGAHAAQEVAQQQHGCAHAYGGGGADLAVGEGAHLAAHRLELGDQVGEDGQLEAEEGQQVDGVGHLRVRGGKGRAGAQAGLGEHHCWCESASADVVAG